jgi:hypothetical protein
MLVVGDFAMVMGSSLDHITVDVPLIFITTTPMLNNLPSSPKILQLLVFLTTCNEKPNCYCFPSFSSISRNEHVQMNITKPLKL